MKKFIPVFLLFFLMIPGMLFAQKKGDVNNDGMVNISDVVAVINIMANGGGEEPAETQVFEVKGTKFTMVKVETGAFMMGSNRTFDSPTPFHEVKINEFYIGQTEVTQELWETVMGTMPQNWKGLQLPIERVSWEDCQAFIKKLNEMTGQKFRLPTEAEWEYAARGGNRSNGYIYSGSNNLDDVAWYRQNSDEKTHIVATKAPNELGIYDMTGNVEEWCNDYYGAYYYENSPLIDPQGPSSGSARCYRGGSWFSYVTGDVCLSCEVGTRGYSDPKMILSRYGFRIAL